MAEFKGRRNVCGIKVRKIRTEKGFSQEKVAVKAQLSGLDLTQKAISRMENGKRLIADYELKYLADALGVSVRELFETAERSEKQSADKKSAEICEP